MVKPILLAVDDEPQELAALMRDLHHRYGEQYRLEQASSGQEALSSLQELAKGEEPLALLLADQVMPEVSGIAVLERARDLFPEAKCVLLTDYKDTDTAIHAINRVRLDYYLLKPWQPADRELYPALDDLLGDWMADYEPPFGGIHVVGHRWSPHAHEIKDFLAGNLVPYRWYDIERDSAAQRLLTSGEDEAQLPLVVFPDGARLSQPSTLQIADQLGLRHHVENCFYDLVIVGGGPAGLAAAVYGASEGLRTVLVERMAPGGQAGTSSRIENYLGFPVGLSGADLARRAVTQARRFGVDILAPQEVTAVRIADPYRIVTLADGSEVSCHALLVATGVSYRTLDVPGAEALTGLGLYYGAAMTEAISCEGDEVYLVGGANSAGQAAMYFSRYARQVTMLVRGDSLAKDMSQYLIDEIQARPNIRVLTHTSVVEVHGERCLEAISVLNSETGERRTIQTGDLFIFIGAMPRTDWLAGVVERDKYGFVLTGPDLPREGDRPRGWPLPRDPYLLETSVPGVFAVGDVRARSIKRVATAVGEGAMAIALTHQHLANVR